MKRKWGEWKVLGEGKGWKVKLIVMKPRAKTSTQQHKYREEVWIGITDPCFMEFVAQGDWHRLINPTNKPYVLIEVQRGSKCVEKDIVRGVCFNCLQELCQCEHSTM